MTPEVRGRMRSIQQQLALPETTEEEKMALVKEAVRLVREARVKVIAVVEAKRPAKRAAKATGDTLLDDLLSVGKEIDGDTS
jgi:ribosome recycling factor